MRYEHQTAKLTHKLTGMPHTQALQMARGRGTERDRSVPDALTADQRTRAAWRATYAGSRSGSTSGDVKSLRSQLCALLGEFVKGGRG